MDEIRPSQLELMRMHAEALYTHDDSARIQTVNEPAGGAASRFFLGRTNAGNLWRFRTDLPGDLVADLEKLCRGKPENNRLSRMPEDLEEYIRLLGSQTPVERVGAGPAYWFPTDAVPGVQPVEIDKTNANLLRGGLENWLVDVPHRGPFMAMVEDGHAVSVCASVRITDAAHEAGVETLPAYRRKGHAVNVVAGWAHSVRKMRAVPLYSTSWDNTASQNVAAKLGLSMFGVDFCIT